MTTATETDFWTLTEAAEVAEVEYRTLHNWVKRGLVSCTLRASTGSGSPNLLSDEDVARCCLYNALRTAGLSMEVVERIAAAINAHDEPEGPFASGWMPLGEGVAVEYDLQHHRDRLKQPKAYHVEGGGKGALVGARSAAQAIQWFKANHDVEGAKITAEQTGGSLTVDPT